MGDSTRNSDGNGTSGRVGAAHPSRASQSKSLLEAVSLKALHLTLVKKRKREFLTWCLRRVRGCRDPKITKHTVNRSLSLPYECSVLRGTLLPCVLTIKGDSQWGGALWKNDFLFFLKDVVPNYDGF